MWREKHYKTIIEFLTFINEETPNFILKGGTALKTCYELDRFSEDIDLDSCSKANIINLVDKFTKKLNYSYFITKNTDTVKRCMLNYGNQERPLKIEVSYRQQNINKNTICNIDGINVYSIDRLAQMKSAAYNARDKIRDLYDLTFICNKYFDKLSDTTKDIITDAISNKGIEQFDLLINTQKDELIDNEKLCSDFLNMYNKLGLIYENNNQGINNTKARKPSQIPEQVKKNNKDSLLHL